MHLGKSILSVIALLGLCPISAQAQVPTVVPFQGFLADGDDNPIDGSVQVAINLFENGSSPTALHTELQTVVVDRGAFTLLLGATSALDLGLFRDNPDVWVEMTIDGDVMPRFAMGSVPYSAAAGFAHAASFDTLTNVPAGLADGDDVLSQADVENWCYDSEAELTAALDDNYMPIGAVLPIADGAVTEAKLANAAISSRTIANGAVQTVHVADGAITTVKLPNGAVTNAKLGANSVDSAKIANGGVGNADIANGSVTNLKLGANAVTSDRIFNNTIAAIDIGTNAVGRDELADNSVWAAEIRDGQVGAAEIATGAVGSSELAANAVTNAKLGLTYFGTNNGPPYLAPLPGGACQSYVTAEFCALNYAQGSCRVQFSAPQSWRICALGSAPSISVCGMHCF